MRIYVDTNVIMDFLLGRNVSAFNLFMEAIRCRHFVVISDLVLDELRFQSLETEASGFVNLCRSNRKISVEKVGEEDRILARNLLSEFDTHYNDALHKVVASRVGCDCIVTRNVKDFICFRDIDVKRPDEI